MNEIQLNPTVYKNPYNEKDFLKMGDKINKLCHKKFDVHYLYILQNELESIDNENNKLFNKKIRNELKSRMLEYTKYSPCAEIFYSSIFCELFNTYKNEPLSDLIFFIERLTLMSKNAEE